MNEPKPIVLAVDDTPANLDVLIGMLRDDYKVRVGISTSTATRTLTRHTRGSSMSLRVTTHASRFTGTFRPPSWAPCCPAWT